MSFFVRLVSVSLTLHFLFILVKLSASARGVVNITRGVSQLVGAHLDDPGALIVLVLGGWLLLRLATRHILLAAWWLIGVVGSIRGRSSRVILRSKHIPCGLTVK